MMAVKVAMCRHLPILVFDGHDAAGGRGKRQAPSMRERNWEGGTHTLRSKMLPVPAVSSRINSVYLDNPESLNVYQRRLLKEENATMHRLRWYGDAAPDVPRPSVFLERKVWRPAV